MERLHNAYNSGRLIKENVNRRGYNKFLEISKNVDITIVEDKIMEDSRWDGLKGNITITNIRVRDNKIVWETRGASDQVRFYAIYRYRKGDDFDASRNTYLVDIVGDAEMPIPIPPTSDREKYYYRISAIDINRNEHPLSAKLSIKY